MTTAADALAVAAVALAAPVRAAVEVGVPFDVAVVLLDESLEILAAAAQDAASLSPVNARRFAFATMTAALGLEG